MLQLDSVSRKPRSYQPIKRCKTVRLWGPLVDSVHISAKTRMDISIRSPLRFDDIDTLDVFETRFNYRASKLIVGATHSLGLPYSSPINVILEKEEVRYMINKIIDAMAEKLKEAGSADGDPEFMRRRLAVATRNLRKVRRVLGMNPKDDGPSFPGGMLLFDCNVVSRIDSVIDFSFDRGLSYKVTRFGSNVHNFVQDSGGGFINFGDTAFLKIKGSDQQYGPGDVISHRNKTMFRLVG